MADTKHDPDSMTLAFQRTLRDELMTHIRDRGLTPEGLAQLAHLLPSGASSLMNREVWPLESAMRVASALSIEIVPHVSPSVDD